MSSWASVVPLAGATVLTVGGCAKLRTSVPVADFGARVLAGGELALAAALLVMPGTLAAAAVAVSFALFSGVHLRATRRGEAGCDCLGSASSRTPPLRAAALTAALALAALLAALSAPTALLALALHADRALVWVLPAGLALGAAWTAAFTLRRPRSGPLPVATDGLGSAVAAGAARFVEARFSRRGLLQEVALVGSALAVAPLRYLLYPGSAMAAIRTGPGDCASGLCLDGYTEFCCQINRGGVNACPADTFPGGWWMCTDYAGRRLCADEGVRYYVDCNAIPGHPFPGGCHCAHDDCNQRRVACNIFRYGQCNTQLPGVTAVVCRLVMCENPSRVSALNCSSSVAVDDAVCGQDAPCLEPPARQLAGAGGA